MLIQARKIRDINFPKLMHVYSESNMENGQNEWPDLPAGFAQEMAEQSFYQYLKEVFFPTDGAFYAVWEEDGRYVSALRMEPYRDGLLLEGLETAPEARKQGYASGLVRNILALLAQKGTVTVYSHVHKKNLPSRMLHEKCGFQVISDHAAYIDGSVNYGACTYVFKA